MVGETEVDEYFTTTIARDFLSVFTGRPLGTGVARTVYECPLRPDLVVKVETEGQSFQNVREWETWQDWEHCKDVNRWLAPCVAISPCGTVLVQMRTTPIPPGRFPDKMPSFLTDMKRDNYGLLKGRVVCHDYGLTVPNLETRLRKARWW